MTSTTSYNNVGKYIWQQLYATRSFILLVAVVYMAIGPLLLAFQMSSLSVLANPVPMLQVLFKDYYMAYFIAAVVLATLGSVYVTRYQNVPSQSNYYHSLPVSRGRLLAGRVLALVIVQFILLLIVTVANLVASALFANSVGEPNIIGPLAASAGLHFVYIMLVFFLAMAMALFAGQLTGTTLGQILMIVVLHITMFIFSGVGTLFLDTFAETYYTGGLTFRLTKFNIFYLFNHMGNINNGFDVVNPLMSSSDLVSMLNVKALAWSMPMIVICVGLTVLFLIATFYLYRRRAVEKAGDTLIFEKVGSVVKGIYVIAGGFFGGFAFFNIASHSFIAFALGVIVASLIVHIVAEMIYSQDVNGIRQHWLSTFVPMVLAIVVAFLFHSGIVSYDDHLPKADHMQSAVIVYNDNASDGQALNTQASQNPEIVNKVAAAMQAAAAERVTNDEMMEGENVPTQTIKVTYKTLLGGVTSRYYNVPTEKAVKIMAPFLNDPHYHESAWPSLANMSIENMVEFIVDTNGFTDFASIDSELVLISDRDQSDNMNKAESAVRLERSKELLKALQSDLKKRNEDILASRVLGYVIYSGKTETAEKMNQSIWGVRYPIYAGDTATAALLQKWRESDILPEEESTLTAALTGLEIKTVDYDDSEQGYTVTGTLSNKAFIDAWLAGEFVYTDQADRYGFDVDKKHGVIVTDTIGETAMPLNDLMRGATNVPTTSYASFYYKNKMTN